MQKVLLVSAVLLFSVHAWAAGSVEVATLEWPPYIASDLPGQGYVAEVVRGAFARSGYDAAFDFLPWARVLTHADKLAVDAYGPEYTSARIAKDYYLSDPFPCGPLVFFKRKDRGISFETLDDVRPYSIGVVRGYVNTAAIDRADFLQKEEAADDMSNLRKLARGRLDLVLVDLNVGRYLQKRMRPDMAALIEPLFPVVEEKKLHICFNKRHPRAKELVKAFNRGLAALRQSGELEAMARRHGMASP